MLGRNPHFVRMKSNSSFNPTRSDIVRRISLAEGEIIPSVKTDLVEKASLSDAFSIVCLTGFVSAKRSKRRETKSERSATLFHFPVRRRRKETIANLQSSPYGVPDRDRTCNRQNRNLILYPIALRVRKKAVGTSAERTPRTALIYYNNFAVMSIVFYCNIKTALFRVSYKTP